MIRSILYMLVCLLCLCSCRSADVSHYISKSDTTFIYTINHDSVHTTDSVYIFQNDTTRVVYKSRNNYIYKVSKDTIYKFVRDTIYIKNDSSKLQRSTSYDDDILLYAALTIAILLILIFIYKKFK